MIIKAIFSTTIMKWRLMSNLAREESQPKCQFSAHAFNNEGMNFEKHFKVHGSLRSTKTNRWYTCVTIGNIWIQYKTVHAYHSLQKKKGATSKWNYLNKNFREEKTTYMWVLHKTDSLMVISLIRINDDEISKYQLEGWRLPAITQWGLTSNDCQWPQWSKHSLQTMSQW